jgi:hypothetical protein
MLGNPRIYAYPNRNIGDDGMNYIYPVWLFFTAFFLYFAYINWRQASADIRPFTFRKRGQDPDEDPEAEVSEANVRFAHDFNAYLDIVNTKQPYPYVISPLVMGRSYYKLSRCHVWDPVCRLSVGYLHQLTI